jgi:large subunit ribosomal protein L30
MAKMVKVKLVKSTIGKPKDQRATVRALGLRRLNQVVEKPYNDATVGMIIKVQHLVELVK